MRLAIIADDITGAMDAAAPFAERGLDVELVLSDAAISLPPTVDVLAVDTHSRHLPPAEAAAAVARCIAALPPGTLLFKKIDLTLRGAIVEEIRAAAPGRGRIIIAPAVPRQGRTVSGGQVLIGGVPLGATESGGDARRRPFAGSLTAALAPLPCAMPDCATESDLMAIARAAPADALLVGAAGLAEAVAQIRFGDATPAALPVLAGPALFVAGSRTAVTAGQLAHLRETRPGRVDRDTARRARGRCRCGRAAPRAAGDRAPASGQRRRARAHRRRHGARRARRAGRGEAPRARPRDPGDTLGEAEIAGRTVVVATKAGGFGTPDALSRIAEKLAAASLPSPA